MSLSGWITRCALSVLLAVGCVSNVWADRVHTHASVGFVFGPFWDPWYYPPYPRYYPAYPPVIIERSPPVYIEQSQVVPRTPESAYWYYCADSGSYYPYVKACPGGWQKVLPQPADTQ